MTPLVCNSGLYARPRAVILGLKTSSQLSGLRRRRPDLHDSTAVGIMYLPAWLGDLQL